jgi:hypothetical protein
MALAAAVVVRGPSGRAFVRADSARQILAASPISRVPNSRLGMALVAGRVVSVVELGAASGALLLCDFAGEPVAFSGLDIERVGLFETDAHGANVDGERLPELVLGDLVTAALGAEMGATVDESE